MNNLINTILIWKLALARLGMDLFMVAGGGWLAAMSGQSWGKLETEYKIALVIGLLMQMCATTRSFLDKTVANLASGNALPPDVKVLTDTTITTPAIAATATAPAVPEKTTTTTVTTPIEPPVKTT